MSDLGQRPSASEGSSTGSTSVPHVHCGVDYPESLLYVPLIRDKEVWMACVYSAVAETSPVGFRT